MPIAVDVPDTDTSTPTTTAAMLGEFRRQLLAEGFDLDVVNEIVKSAAAEILPFGLVLKAGEN